MSVGVHPLSKGLLSLSHILSVASLTRDEIDEFGGITGHGMSNAV